MGVRPSMGESTVTSPSSRKSSSLEVAPFWKMTSPQPAARGLSCGGRCGVGGWGGELGRMESGAG